MSTYYRRAYCPHCRRQLSITRDGNMRRHGRQGVWPPVDCPGVGQPGTETPAWTPQDTPTTEETTR